MKSSTQAKNLRTLFETLETATVAGDSDARLVSIAKKRVDCVEDTFGGIRCG